VADRSRISLHDEAVLSAREPRVAISAEAYTRVANVGRDPAISAEAYARVANVGRDPAISAEAYARVANVGRDPAISAEAHARVANVGRDRFPEFRPHGVGSTRTSDQPTFEGDQGLVPPPASADPTLSVTQSVSALRALRPRDHADRTAFSRSET
jgi:hypothetical protein